MTSLTRSIIRLEGALHPLAIIGLVTALNVGWALTLQSFAIQFQSVAGRPLLDLQNTQGILSASAALALVREYSTEARSLYWVFFILDNIVPLLSFGSFALLWAALLRRTNAAPAERLLSSPLLLLPLGVGLFDVFENVAFLTVIHQPSAELALPLMRLGLAFVWLKAACLFSTFILTPILLALWAGAAAWDKLRGTPHQPTS